MDTAINWDNRLINKYNLAGPRYTSYPTAAQFASCPVDARLAYLSQPANVLPAHTPLSLYVHIPFCAYLCYYCGCNKTHTRDKAKGDEYLHALEKEITHLAPFFEGRPVTQLHWGGGTPTFLTRAQQTELIAMLAAHFNLLPNGEGEYSIEIDPRETDDETLIHLKHLGFNRISMGVQDFQPETQKAINRIQPVSLIRKLVSQARALDFKSVNFDLIYGLPHQTVASFKRTLDEVIDISPDRIAAYSYAHLPERFPAQKRFASDALPDASTKMALLKLTIETLTEAGYVYIGMDHFAKPTDNLSQALEAGTLQRNFQGYSTHANTEMLGLGVSSISAFNNAFFQNDVVVKDYYTAMHTNTDPVKKACYLEKDDHLRQAIIQQIMCQYELNVAAIEEAFGIDFATYFQDELDALKCLEQDKLIAWENEKLIKVTNAGRLLVRIIAMSFDKYLAQQTNRFSKVV